MKFSAYFIACYLVSCFGAQALDSSTPRYYFATFDNTDQTKLYITASFDGRKFSTLTGAHVYTAPLPDTLRDPSIIRLPDAWYICHTAGNFGNVTYFTVLRSTDLINWTKVTDVSTASIPNTRFTWAPEWFQDEDGSVHIIVGVSYWMSREFAMFAIHPTNASLTTWSAPQRLTGSAFPTFIHNPNPDTPQYVGAYDAHIIKRSGEYYITYFDVNTSYIFCAKSPALTGPYTPFKTGNWQGIGSYKEGGTMVSLGGPSWRFYYADAIFSKMYYIESGDNWVTWSPATLLDSTIVFNHGTVVYNPSLPEFKTTLEPLDGGSMRVRFPAVNKNGYRLETSSDLMTWNQVGSVMEGLGGEMAIDHNPLGAPRMFYRIRWLPFHTPAPY